ncbi:MAG: MFS transporter [Chloroflexota bacterium]
MTHQAAQRPPLLAAAYLSMITMGTNSTMTGALLPVIVRVLNLDVAQAGLLAAGPGLGYIVAVALAGLLGDAVGYRSVWLAGVGMGLLALLGLALAPSFGWLLPAVAALGLVGGFFDGGINPLMTALTAGRAGGVLNRVHAFFGVGATTGPLVVSLGMRLGLPWRWHYALPLAYLLAVGALVARHPVPRVTARAALGRATLGAALRRRPVALGALAMLLYGGVEACLFSWTALYLVQARGASPASASLAVSLFGLSLLAGRFATSAVVERLGYRRLVVGGSLVGAAGVAVLIWSPGPVLPWVGVGLAGLAWAGIFATIVADVAAQTPDRAGAVAGLVCASSGLGKIALPWLVGQVALGGGVAAGLSLVVALATFMGLSYTLSRG